MQRIRIFFSDVPSCGSRAAASECSCIHVSEHAVQSSPLLAQLAQQQGSCYVPLTEKAFRCWMEYSEAGEYSAEQLCDVLQVLSETTCKLTETLCLQLGRQVV